MFNENKKLKRFFMNCQFLFILSIALVGVALGQNPTASPTPDETVVNGFTVKSSIEIGGRYKSLSGSENKFKSDLNYKSGIRVFNSSFLMEDKEGRNKYFDSLLVNTSGWGADPSGNARVNLEKKGGYRFTSNVRRVKYFNNLNNHALNQHNSDTTNTLGDFDVTVFPQSDKLRLNFGYSFSRYLGPFTTNGRGYRDDFVTGGEATNKSNDFRGGIAGKLLGFNMSFTQGYRNYIDKTKLTLAIPTAGNNTTDTTVFNTFTRSTPANGETFYSTYDVNRTFAKKLDFTGRIMYSYSSTKTSMDERITGRDNSNNFVDLDRFDISAKSYRPQTRGDLGVSYRATDKITISNTFSFDQFAISGDENLYEQLIRRSAAGVGLPTTITRSGAYRINKFRKFTNLIEGDIQFNNKISFHIGYRYTKRNTTVNGIDTTYTSSVSATNPLFITETEENSTNTVIAGMKIKPTNNWVIYWDVEKGDADNVFTRIENYKFTNFRVRSRLTLNKFAFSFSGISKDNTNPARTDAVPAVGFGPKVKSRIFSGTIDWNPIPEFGVSSGYTYTHQTSKTPLYIITAANARVLGRSEYYVRDHNAFIDVVVNPVKRVSLFGSYRISKDLGQGNIPLTNPYSALISSSSTITLVSPELIILSYPIQFQSPEFRAVFRLTRNIDWNIGYQYFNYKEKFQSLQNYKAHLPYTSFTFYIGGADR